MKRSSLKSRIVALSVVVVLAASLSATADGVDIDNDLTTNGAQRTVSLAATPGEVVNTAAQFVVNYQGSRHLTPGTSATFAVDSSTTQTTLPPGYSVGNAVISIPGTWSAGDRATASSAISFTAPLVAGPYSFQVRWLKPTGFTCLTIAPCISAPAEPFTVDLTVTEAPGQTNVSPTVDAGGPYSGSEGAAVSLSGSASDADIGDAVATTWSYVVGSADPGTTCSFSNANSLTSTITCTDDGTFTLTLTANDGHNPDVTDIATLTLSNANPTVSSATFALATVNCGPNNATLNVAFSDPGSNDTHTATINWGDGSPLQNLGSVLTVFSASHTYNSGGAYTAIVSITDDDGGSGGSSSGNTLTVNYNLSGILQPINDTRKGQATSLFKYGSTIPVKVEITDCNGIHPTTLDVRVFTQVTASDPPPVGTDEAVATNSPDAGNAMRFSDPIYIFNLASKKTSIDPTATVRIDVFIPSTNQITWSFIGLKK